MMSARLRQLRMTLLVGLATLTICGVGAAVGEAPAHAAPAHRLLISGDSITQGSSGDYTWRYRLWKKLNSTAPGNVTLVGTRTDLWDNVNDRPGSLSYADPSFPARSHVALWGSSYKVQVDNIQSQVSTTGATTLVTMLGLNDLAYFTTPADTITAMRAFVSRARAGNSGVDIVVGRVLRPYDPWSGTYRYTAEVADYNSRLTSAVSQLDTANSRVVIASAAIGWNASIHTWDGVHPNATGETLIAQRVSEALATIGLGASSPNIFATTAWKVAGPTPAAEPAPERANLSWNRTATGALSMFISQRLVTIGEAFGDPLPYPVPGDAWIASSLAAGGTYEWALTPSKGFMTGQRGPAKRAFIDGLMPSKLPAVAALRDGRSSFGGYAIRSWWFDASWETGYMVSYTDMTPRRENRRRVELPYALAADTTTFRFEGLGVGRYYEAGAQPIRFFKRQSPTYSVATRTNGIPGGAQHVAMGDSYSSGLGSISSNDYQGGGCLRTTEAWPHRFLRNWKTLSLLACAGNTTTQVRDTQLGPMGTMLATTDAPKLVTMTVGGNDIGFSEKLAECVLRDCSQDGPLMTQRIRDLGPVLTRLYRDMKAKNPYGDTLVGGYPNVLAASGWSNDICFFIGGDERELISTAVAQLNAQIEDSAQQAGVWSFGESVVSEFRGHEACSPLDVEWINSLDFDLGNKMGVGPNSFHPNLGGQLAYANAVLSTYMYLAG